LVYDKDYLNWCLFEPSFRERKIGERWKKRREIHMWVMLC